MVAFSLALLCLVRGLSSWCCRRAVSLLVLVRGVLVLLLSVLFCGFRILSDSGCRRGLFFVVDVLSWVGLVLCGSGSVWCCRCGVFFVVGVFVVSVSLLSVVVWFVGGGGCVSFSVLVSGGLVLCSSCSLRFFVVCVFMFGSFCR